MKNKEEEEEGIILIDDINIPLTEESEEVLEQIQPKELDEILVIDDYSELADQQLYETAQKYLNQQQEQEQLQRFLTHGPVSRPNGYYPGKRRSKYKARLHRK